MSKTPNYTAEMTTTLVEAYNESVTPELRDQTVAHFAKLWGKSTKSIVAKLSREGVYIKATREGKKGGVKKGEVANAIGAFLRLSENEVSSLEKANMTALTKVWNFIREASGEVGKVD